VIDERQPSDRRFMHEALLLADNALFTATPNPRVGCVIVKGDEIIGSGWTQVYGSAHAEQHALANCTADPAGATAYITLEPCNHVGPSGRSESCVASLTRAGIRRVVVGALDPSPRMSGASLELLKASGIAVDAGEGADEAREQNLGFFSRMTRGRPWVRIKLAASLDGRTALADGTSQWITGEAARNDGHSWRARACAVLTGAGTVLQDDPALTVRAIETPRHPRRIVVDRHAQAPASARIFAGDDPVWVFAASPPQSPLPRNVEVIVLRDRDGRVDFPAMMQELGRRRINELHVEAGSKLAGALIAAGFVDELLLYFAPCLLGDAARGMFAFPSLATLNERVRLDIRSVVRIGDDWRVIARLGEPESANGQRVTRETIAAQARAGIEGGH
jgi:diaminohydroxyphosphoribosylaminopyrimidine deaminase/5-amino-6-(5-phosphoribosylamino)uracil reductase